MHRHIAVNPREIEICKSVWFGEAAGQRWMAVIESCQSPDEGWDLERGRDGRAEYLKHAYACIEPFTDDIENTVAGDEVDLDIGVA